jgi:glycosyltransferase involved in cell wall biosynthesis
MRISILINNFNYKQYVFEAVDSVLNQSVQADEIIIVDDGSTDGSAQLLRDKFADHEKIKLHLKDQNEGQLSCFNHGFLASTGEIICFLDADDVYHEDYIKEVLTFYKQHESCDFLICGYELFGNKHETIAYYDCDRDLGLSQISTLWGARWLGSATSALSVRRHILERFLPLPFLENWRTCADDCLVLSSSIVGARKFYLAKSLVKYRVHGKNNFYGNRSGGALHEKKGNALIASFKGKDPNLDNETTLTEQTKTEFMTIPKPRYQELKLYAGVIKQFEKNPVSKITGILSLCFYFLRTGDFFGKVPFKHVRRSKKAPWQYADESR